MKALQQRIVITAALGLTWFVAGYLLPQDLPWPIWIAWYVSVLVAPAAIIGLLLQHRARERRAQHIAHGDQPDPHCMICRDQHWRNDRRANKAFVEMYDRDRNRQLRAHETAYRDHRDHVLADESRREATRAYLALPEQDKYEAWLAWQLGSQGADAETLPWPPPHYPPPER